MKSAPATLLTAVLRRRRWVVGFYLILAAAMLPGVLLLELDNSPEVFFVRDAAVLERFRQMELYFGRERTFRVILKGSGVWTPEGLDWLARLEREAPKRFGVLAAAGPYGHHRWRLPAWPPAEPEALRARMGDDLLDREAGWIGADGDTLTVVVGLYKLSAAKQRRVLADIEDLLKTAPPAIEVSIAGLPALNRAMDEALLDIALRFFPLLFVIVAILLGVVLRRFSQVAMALLLVAIVELVAFGAIGYSGISFNLITVVLAPLLLVITLATAVHVLMLFRRLREQGLESHAAVLETYRVKAWPVFWTGLTTAVAFGSLAVSRVPPVQALGGWSAAAIAFMTVALLSLYPALLAGQRAAAGQPRPTPLDRWAGRRGRRWAQWAVAHRTIVWLIFATSALALLGGIALLRVDTNLREYFAPAHPMRIALGELEQAGIGPLAANLVLSRRADAGTGPARFDEPRELERLAALAVELRSIEGVAGAVSAADLVAAAGDVDPATSESAVRSVQALAEIRGSPERRLLLDTLLTADGERSRIVLFIPMDSFSELDPVFARALALAKQRFANAEVYLSGQYPLVLEAQKSLLKTMILSLAMTLAAITLILRGILGSLPLALRALLPNIWPVAFVLGAMGWAGIPVDSTMVMIAAVVLGLAVDDTLHSLGYFRRLLRRLPPPEAAIATLERSAPAHLLTSLVLAAGFGVLAFSSFLPVARFGALSSAALLTALVADLLLVPALLAGLPAAAASKFRFAGDGG